jgi:hypothetical protein
MTNISVTATNDGFSDHTYHIIDVVADTQWDVSVRAHDSTVLALRSDQALDDGYGHFTSEQVGSGVVVDHALLRDGENASL